jgi:ATP-binding cassette subfamily B protein
MFIKNWKLTLIILCVVPFIIGFTIMFKKMTRKAYRQVRTDISNMNAFLSENISGMKVTQIFNQEEKKYNEFKTVNTRLMKASLKEIFCFGIFRPTVYLIYISTVIAVLYTGSNEALTAGFIGCITFSELFTFYQLISKFFNPIQTLADQYNVLQSSFAAAEKVFTILDVVPEVQDTPNAKDIDIIGNIEFKNVWFCYDDGEWILKDVSFTINAKDVVAFVGATGAGKTTILGLITRNYDIQKGQILIDGIDIKDITLSSLRSQIGQMLQDVFLFSGNIADNIRLNDETITDEEIIAACKEVNAIHFINKHKEGIYAKVGERGNNLSLGERQLVSFARVLVHKPKLMILDEATSNIDTETEKLIQDSLEKVIKSNTMIMVAHRLSTIKHATKIIVLDHGRIIEQGSHQELLKKRGRYYQLYKLQYQQDPFDN